MSVEIINKSNIDLIVFNDHNKSFNKNLETLKYQINDLNVIVVKDNQGANQIAQELYSASKPFFSLSERDKNQYKAKVTGLSGYHAMNTEKAINSDVYDNKEFWHTIRELSEDSSLKYTANKWPISFSQMREKSYLLYSILDLYSKFTLSLIEKYLGISQGMLNDMCIDGPSILRNIHYPKTNLNKITRAHEHTGIQLLGVQPKASDEGIEFYSDKYNWFKFSKDFNDCIFINIGETLQYITNNMLTATRHRVATTNKSGHTSERFAAVFFHHVNPTTTLKNVFYPNDLSTPHIKAHDWIKTRINEISMQKNFT